MQNVKSSSEDFITYAARVNKMCEDFKLASLSPDEFKSLIFVIGLKDQRDSDIRTRLLQKIESSEKTTLTSLTDDCQNIIRLRTDTNMIGKIKSESKNELTVNKIDFKKKIYTNKSKQDEQNAKPKYPCWKCCGIMHFAKDCTYSNHNCKRCGQLCQVWSIKFK